MSSGCVGLGVRLLVLSLLLVLLFYGGTFFVTSRGVQYEGRSRAGHGVSRLRIKGDRRPAACVLFKENTRNFSTSSARLQVDQSPVTDTLRRPRPLAWGGENNHKLANTRCARTASGEGRAELSWENQHLLPRASPADYGKLVDYSELLRPACHVLAPLFCSAPFPVPTLTYRLGFPSKGILIFPLLSQNCVKG